MVDSLLLHSHEADLVGIQRLTKQVFSGVLLILREAFLPTYIAYCKETRTRQGEDMSA